MAISRDSTGSRRRFERGCATALLAGVVAMVGGAGLGGCAKPLLSPAEERTPFDRYDAMRAQHAPQYVENEYGRRVPNLRGRLSPKN